MNGLWSYSVIISSMVPSSSNFFDIGNVPGELEPKIEG